MATFVSPNALLESARQEMLSGREPANRLDWVKVVNYFASKIEPSCALPTVKIMCMLFDVPLTEREVKMIVEFQLRERN